MHDALAADGERLPSIRQERPRDERLRVLAKRLDFFAVRYIPQAQSGIIAAGKSMTAIGAEGNAFDATFMPREDAQQPARCRFPQAKRAVVTGG